MIYTSADNLRSFDDVDKTRKFIYDNVLSTLSKKFPIEDDEYRLELVNLRYSGPQSFTLSEQKNALLKDKKLTTPLVGTWRLYHKPTNTIIEEKEDVVMHVPYITQRGTIISGGNEYSVVNQARLRPGVYIRKRRTGEVESQFNVAQGKGTGFRIQLEPSTGMFKINIGQSNIPLYPLLKAFDVPDKQLIQTWGADLAAVNAKYDPRDLQKLYERFAGFKADKLADEIAQKRFIATALPTFELDEEVNKRTIGLEKAKGVTPDVILRATQKMLGVSRGEEEPDDRDAPQFAQIFSIEDLITERIEKDSGKILKNILNKIKRKKSLSVVERGIFDSYIDGLIHGSGLAMPLEETNPLHTLEQLNRITRMGEGGIGSPEAVTAEARDVNLGQLGFIDPIAGPEHSNIGVDVRVAYKTFKGRDQKLYGEFLDPKSNKKVYVSADEIAQKTLAYPGQDLTPGKEVYATKRGKIVKVPVEEVDYVVPSLAHMMSANTNLNPMPTAVQAGRQFYASKFWSQYMPLKEGEAPLVDTLMPDDKLTFSEYYGRKIGSVVSDVEGKVLKVTDNEIVVLTSDGKKKSYDIVKDFPFNRLTAISYFPIVKPGQVIKKGDLLAHSNFTDKKTGAINIGRNLKTAIIPYRGLSYEDGQVISESAAKKLAIERLEGFDVETRHGVDVGKNKYISLFPKKYTIEQLNKLDEHGIARPGTILQKGDPIILAIGPKLLSSADAQLGRLHKVLRNAFTDHSVVWENDFPGVVTDAVLTRHGAKVNVKSTPPLKVGDKISTRAGLKGVISAIVPDDKMPRDAVTNEPYEVLLNPMTILSRVAPNQIMEIALGKVAKKTGQRIALPQEPPPEGWAVWVKKKLEEAGIKETADLFDPETGKVIKDIGDGYMYVSAFHHLSDKKLSARGEEGGYDINQQPAKGGKTGSKRFSALDINAALAHGATEVIKDVMTIRGTKNEEFWKALKLGRPLPEPGVPFVYTKMLETLKAGGINVAEKGDILSLMPMTDDDIMKLSKGRIETSNMVDYDFNPIENGLFDPGKTGGMSGNRWTHFDLPEPIPNPVMEEPIRRLLGLKIQQLEDILAGREKLNGLTGGTAIKKALEAIDIDKAIQYHRDRVKSTRGAVRDNSIKIIGYLTALKKQGLHPSQWMISKIPIIPPIFRPISKLGDIALTADLNELYRDLIELTNSYNELKKEVPYEELADERLNIYNAAKAIFGLGDPITPEGRSKRLKGAIRQIIGTQPKYGLAQAKVFSKPVDVVGRGVVTPDPNLDMDHVGIPEDSAWTLYKDFVLRALVRRGHPVTRALEMIKNREPTAREMLEKEMAYRPVILDRAPTWHKFNLLAFYPKISDGSVVRVSPLVTKGFNMDFDGDTANFHVPVSEKAVEEAKNKMLPSRNLFSLTDLSSIRHSPSMEMTMGLYWLTRDPAKKPVKRFRTVEEAEKAYRAGLIRANDPIEIINMK